MREKTKKQIANAFATDSGKRVWCVKSSYANPNELSASEPMSFRQAKATARAVIEGLGWADVCRMPKQSDFLAAIGPCGK